jgi:ribosomal protein S18 acetylase RimI-like enzyme
MSDALDASRLGDLPNAGYATKRERELTDAIMLFMRKVERDRLFLLHIVVEGREKFASVVLKEYRGLGLVDRLVDQMYEYFRRQAGANPLGQLEALERMTNRERYGLL